jgi:sporulation protein YlmC with PRC-barrel domain
MPQDDRLTMRDIVDGLLEASDGTDLGRVADVLISIDADGSARLTDLVIGPEALAGRVSSRLHPLAHWLLRGRFEHTIPIDEVEEFGPTLILRHPASHYDAGHADEWVNRHLLRFIPGSGAR